MIWVCGIQNEFHTGESLGFFFYWSCARFCFQYIPYIFIVIFSYTHLILKYILPIADISKLCQFYNLGLHTHHPEEWSERRLCLFRFTYTSHCPLYDPEIILALACTHITLATVLRSALVFLRSVKRIFQFFFPLIFI